MKVNTKVKRKIYLKRVDGSKVDGVVGCANDDFTCYYLTEKLRGSICPDCYSSIFTKVKTVTTIELTEVH